MATINDLGIPGIGTGILQPLLKNQPLVAFSVLTDDDNDFLTKNLDGVGRPCDRDDKTKKFAQNGEFYLSFKTEEDRLLKLLNNLKALSGTVFLTPHVYYGGNGEVCDFYFVNHCRCDNFKNIESGRTGALFTYQQIYWRIQDDYYEDGYKRYKTLDKSK